MSFENIGLTIIHEFSLPILGNEKGTLVLVIHELFNSAATAWHRSGLAVPTVDTLLQELR